MSPVPEDPAIRVTAGQLAREGQDAADRVEAFLRESNGMSEVIRSVPGRDGMPSELTRADVWTVLAMLDMPLAAHGAVSHPLRARLVEAIGRQQVNPALIADTALNVVGRAIGGRR